METNGLWCVALQCFLKRNSEQNINVTVMQSKLDTLFQESEKKILRASINLCVFHYFIISKNVKNWSIQSSLNKLQLLYLSSFFVENNFSWISLLNRSTKYSSMQFKYWRHYVLVELFFLMYVFSKLGKTISIKIRVNVITRLVFCRLSFRLKLRSVNQN